MNLPKYSMGIGDRFAHQGKAQLAAFIRAKQLGVDVTPVWNKSNREHNIVHSEPASVRAEADAAVRTLNSKDAYFVDADHIGLQTVDRFIAASDFFTIDVADFIAKPPDADALAPFVKEYARYAGALHIPGIEAAKGAGAFIPEISMDETDHPQTPVELLFILGAIASEKIPVRTIAPKFTGRFNKGVDYVGDVTQFEREFNDDLAVIAFAVKEFGLPADLKLSVHSGSDKFSIYPAIRRALRRTGAGLHLKTAGTTWLEELIGLALAGGEGLHIAKDVYTQALARFDELCAPYATVIDIDKSKLPTTAQVADWSGDQYAATLRHDQSNPQYNPHVRQLLHVGFKVAAQMGDRYTNALKEYEPTIAQNVTENLFDRHLKRVFLDEEAQICGLLTCNADDYR